MSMRLTEDGSDESIVAEINITPLTDVFLVLLIIFMISSSVMMEGGLNIKLPSAKNQTGAGSSTDNKPIVITMTKEGTVQVQGKTVSANEIESTLREALSQTTQKTVVIRGDESIVLGSAVSVMDAARSAGAEKIAVATQPKSK